MYHKFQGQSSPTPFELFQPDVKCFPLKLIWVTPNIDTLLISETSVTIYQSTRRKVPQNMSLHSKICMRGWGKMFANVLILQQFWSATIWWSNENVQIFKKGVLDRKCARHLPLQLLFENVIAPLNTLRLNARDAFGKACRSSRKVFLIRSRCLTKTNIITEIVV